MSQKVTPTLNVNGKTIKVLLKEIADIEKWYSVNQPFIVHSQRMVVATIGVHTANVNLEKLRTQIFIQRKERIIPLLQIKMNNPYIGKKSKAQKKQDKRTRTREKLQLSKSQTAEMGKV